MGEATVLAVVILLLAHTAAACVPTPSLPVAEGCCADTTCSTVIDGLAEELTGAACVNVSLPLDENYNCDAAYAFAQGYLSSLPANTCQNTSHAFILAEIYQGRPMDGYDPSIDSDWCYSPGRSTYCVKDLAAIQSRFCAGYGSDVFPDLCTATALPGRPDDIVILSVDDADYGRQYGDTYNVYNTTVQANFVHFECLASLRGLQVAGRYTSPSTSYPELANAIFAIPNLEMLVLYFAHSNATDEAIATAQQHLRFFENFFGYEAGPVQVAGVLTNITVALALGGVSYNFTATFDNLLPNLEFLIITDTTSTDSFDVGWLANAPNLQAISLYMPALTGRIPQFLCALSLCEFYSEQSVCAPSVGCCGVSLLCSVQDLMATANCNPSDTQCNNTVTDILAELTDNGTCVNASLPLRENYDCDAAYAFERGYLSSLDVDVCQGTSHAFILGQILQNRTMDGYDPMNNSSWCNVLGRQTYCVQDLALLQASPFCQTQFADVFPDLCNATSVPGRPDDLLILTVDDSVGDVRSQFVHFECLASLRALFVTGYADPSTDYADLGTAVLNAPNLELIQLYFSHIDTPYSEIVAVQQKLHLFEAFFDWELLPVVVADVLTNNTVVLALGGASYNFTGAFDSLRVNLRSLILSDVTLTDDGFDVGELVFAPNLESLYLYGQVRGYVPAFLCDLPPEACTIISLNDTVCTMSVGCCGLTTICPGLQDPYNRYAGCYNITIEPVASDTNATDLPSCLSFCLTQNATFFALESDTTSLKDLAFSNISLTNCSCLAERPSEVSLLNNTSSCPLGYSYVFEITLPTVVDNDVVLSIVFENLQATPNGPCLASTPTALVLQNCTRVRGSQQWVLDLPHSRLMNSFSRLCLSLLDESIVLANCNMTDNSQTFVWVNDYILAPFGNCLTWTTASDHVFAGNCSNATIWDIGLNRSRDTWQLSNSTVESTVNFAAYVLADFTTEYRVVIRLSRPRNQAVHLDILLNSTSMRTLQSSTSALSLPRGYFDPNVTSLSGFVQAIGFLTLTYGVNLISFNLPADAVITVDWVRISANDSQISIDWIDIMTTQSNLFNISADVDLPILYNASYSVAVDYEITANVFSGDSSQCGATAAAELLIPFEIQFENGPAANEVQAQVWLSDLRQSVQSANDIHLIGGLVNVTLFISSTTNDSNGLFLLSNRVMLKTISLFHIFPTPAFNGGFGDLSFAQATTAAYYAQFADAAYSIHAPGTVAFFSNEHYQVIAESVLNPFGEFDPAYTALAAILIKKAGEREILIIIRGTDPSSLTDVWTDADHLATPFFLDSSIWAHHGFQYAYRASLRSWLRYNIFRSFAKISYCGPSNEHNCRIVITGHSLGGALSIIAAWDLLVSLRSFLKQANVPIIHLVTFGAPMVFIHAPISFRAMIDSTAIVPLFLENIGDPVPVILADVVPTYLQTYPQYSFSLGGGGTCSVVTADCHSMGTYQYYLNELLSTSPVPIAFNYVLLSCFNYLDSNGHTLFDQDTYRLTLDHHNSPPFCYAACMDSWSGTVHYFGLNGDTCYCANNARINKGYLKTGCGPAANKVNTCNIKCSGNYDNENYYCGGHSSNYQYISLYYINYDTTVKYVPGEAQLTFAQPFPDYGDYTWWKCSNNQELAIREYRTHPCCSIFYGSGQCFTLDIMAIDDKAPLKWGWGLFATSYMDRLSVPTGVILDAYYNNWYCSNQPTPFEGPLGTPDSPKNVVEGRTNDFCSFKLRLAAGFSCHPFHTSKCLTPDLHFDGKCDDENKPLWLLPDDSDQYGGGP